MSIRRVARCCVLFGLSAVLLGATHADDPPLVGAARHADWQQVSALLADGVDVNAVAGDGSTALHWASYWDELDIAERLVRAGANAGAANDLGATPLWAAALNGSPAMARLLLGAGSDPNAALLPGETVLMTASRTGNAEVVEQLLVAGADPNRSAARGQTALMWAAAQRHPEVVELLVRYGADVHARSDSWNQVMAVPPHSEPENQADVPHGGNTALMFAARVGDLASARILVTAGADVNDRDAWGVSATVLAAHSGFRDLVEFLLEEGADPNLADAGFSALHIAIMRRDEEMARALLAHGADPNAPLRSWTPTRRASRDWNFHQALVGAAPLWMAARFTLPGIMRLLVEHGADPHAVHDADYIGGIGAFGAGRLTDSNTALMAAVGMGAAGRPWVNPAPEEREALTLEAVALLVELGVDLNAVSPAGRTALDGASGLGFDSVGDFLREHGAMTADRALEAGAASALAGPPPC